MRFEEQVTLLCAKALAAHDEDEARKLLTELRIMLHQQIEQLRSVLLGAYSASLIRNDLPDATPKPGITQPPGAAIIPQVEEMPPRAWQHIIHEIAGEPDDRKALWLSKELNRILQRHSESSGPC
jgi:hypothetical protein